MPATWAIVPYRERPRSPDDIPMRYCAMDDWTPLVVADGGWWSECECLGNRAIVKVRASLATLQTIQTAEPTFRRLPKDRLDDSLASLSTAQKRALRDWIEEGGYPRAEWQADLGTDLGAITLRQVLRFLLKRRLKPRYDRVTDTVVLDGPVQPTRPLEHADADVTGG